MKRKETIKVLSVRLCQLICVLSLLVAFATIGIDDAYQLDTSVPQPFFSQHMYLITALSLMVALLSGLFSKLIKLHLKKGRK